MIRRRLLGWVMNAILVLSVISFSPYVSQPKSFSKEPTRTELKHTSRASDEKSVHFGVNHDGPGHFVFSDQTKNFYSRLCQFELQIEVKFKGTLGNCAIDDKQFLIHYFTYNSEASATDDSRG